jgi:hypothetical protein
MVPADGSILNRASLFTELNTLGAGGIPWMLQVTLGLTVLAGIVLWVSGRRVLKPTVGFIAAGAGALLGLLAVPALAPDAGVSPLVGCLGGWVIGLLSGILLYRPCVALLFGVALGAGTAVAAAGVLTLVANWPPPSFEGLFTSGSGRQSQVAGVVGGRGSTEFRLTDSPTPAVSVQAIVGPLAEGARDMAAAARDLGECLEHEARLGWDQSSTRDRIIMCSAGGVGLLVGAWLGLSLPAWAASGVTALVGAAIWLPGAVWLAHATNLPGRDALSLPPTGWTIVWVVVSILGMAAQWAGLLGGKPAATTKPAASS